MASKREKWRRCDRCLRWLPVDAGPSVSVCPMGHGCATPEAPEPEGGDPWEITDEDLIQAAGAAEGADWPDDLLCLALEDFRDRLRARVQPRRVSREEWDLAVRGLLVDMGQMRHETAIRGFLNVLGIMPRISDEITPTEED